MEPKFLMESDMRREISNHDDVIDSRDVIERIEELETEQEEAKGDWDGLSELDAPPAFLEWERENGAELDSLRKLAAEASGYAADWQYGETLIRDSYFKEYAMQLADDLGIEAPTQWPYTCVDWDQAARELQMDYTSVDFDGVTYWTR